MGDTTDPAEMIAMFTAELKLKIASDSTVQASLITLFNLGLLAELVPTIEQITTDLIADEGWVKVA